MKKIQAHVARSKEFEELQREVGALNAGESVVLRGVAGSLLAFIAEAVFDERQKQVLLIAADEDCAEKLRDDCALLLGEQNVRIFGARPVHPGRTLDMSSSIAQIETLRALVSETQLLVVASPQSIVEKVPPPERFRQIIIELETNKVYAFQNLITRLQEIGFGRKNFVETYGDFAVRGGILDVFPYVGDNPIRCEFWGDTVESIREFDVLSQRSIRELQSASIVPSLTVEEGFTAGKVDEADSGSAREALTSSLFDYLQPDAIVLLDEPAAIEREIDELLEGGASNIFSFADVRNRAGKYPLVINTVFGTGRSEIPNPKSQIDFGSISQPSFNGSVNNLVASLEAFLGEGYTVYLTSDTKEESQRLKELIEEVVTSPENSEEERAHHRPSFPFPIGRGDVADEAGDRGEGQAHLPHLASHIQPEFLSETIHSGFTLPSAKLAVFTEHEIFGRLRRRGLAKRRRFKGFSQKELQQLKSGDYVVHVDYGIGVFDGLTRINVGGTEQEVMKLQFLEEDVLYVNLNFINRVQKYSSQEGHTPKLTKLGAAEWERIKSRAKKRIKDIARDIIALYARRKQEKGFAFSPDTHWQKEMEASFMYDDTPDQAIATLDVKRDMESPSPMDRLICGDVGFGKTEVAVRAAFKSVMDGKQVAVLVPTTILALQHFNTFQDRLSRYTVRIENITRFKSTKDQKRIIEEMKQGKVDIVIGTHRLISKDVGFKDLGLLIIDEEHRFGVAAKEKLRQLKASVDTLSLTATPIPRTLHFSLIGARDLSLINTPPRNRLPIVTEIIPADSTGRLRQWHVAREAIVRELHRSGQVYFVHDRVQNIEAIADEIRRHVPEARVHVAHGQMHGHELEKTMLEFLEKKYDVLVATKIIESGLDIPNVNTIVVNRADRFGLAELYQLRGRVGRSNVQAYSYLLTPPLSAIPKAMMRRLQAIEEFTELGSGFNLSMRDLEIRGAGNLLGAEQSGFIMEMGFEMYERVLREAVDELKQEEFQDIFQKQPASRIAHLASVETVIESDIEALIPDVYIQSDSERLDVYRRIYRATNESELQEIRNELSDRFGEYPEEVENLFGLVELRLVVLEMGFPKVSLRGEMLTVNLPDETNEWFYGKDGDDGTAPFQKIVEKIQKDPKNIRLKQEGKVLTVQFTQPPGDGTKKRLEEARKRIDEMSLIGVSSSIA
ncbi:MAG: transcription-repair coupling factor [Ignavibacteriae bacterium]|nr:transcription-repair coupling factor [Ignavibacteria bacterium]MBI3364125.1 transcription-repair coupling factor [Ignavibacteriota bacterium]